MTRRWIRYVALPRRITPLEESYLTRLNRIGLLVVAAHVPVLVFIAWWNDTGPASALALCALAMVGPLLACRFDDQPRRVSTVLGVAAVMMAGILVHVGQGPMQIEMHFHFFVVIAALAVFGNPSVILVAAVTVALHHFVVWLLHPASVFNYEASVVVVAVHALFVVLEAIGACFLSRSFFDNVIGLERIVGHRTAALEERRQDMRLLLDNVVEGFLTMDEGGGLGLEHSRAIDTWFGDAAQGSSWFELLDTVAPDFARQTRSGWEAVVDDFLPLELNLAQMPSCFVVGQRTLHVEYRPILSGPDLARRYLIVVSDTTKEVEEASAAADRNEDLQLVSALLDDRNGTLAFLDDALPKLAALETGQLGVREQWHLLHTLKGNAAMAGLAMLASRTHGLEDLLAERSRPLAQQDVAPFVSRFERLAARCGRLRGEVETRVEVATSAVAELEAIIHQGATEAQLLDRVRDLRRESIGPRLARLADHATRVAEKLGKGRISVEVLGDELKVDPTRWAPVWASLVHAVRNAVDHGLESPAERTLAGKSAVGTLTLRASEEDGWVRVNIEDDGRGIDVDRVRASAAALGLTVAKDEDALEALWVDGLTTSDQPTEVSGRGVGMSAIRSAVEALGGTVELRSEPGHGVRMSVSVPRRSVEEALGRDRPGNPRSAVQSARRPSSALRRADTNP